MARKLKLDNDVAVGNGHTYTNIESYDNCKIDRVEIGYKEIHLADGFIKDMDYMKCLVSIGHEFRHVQQIQDMIHSDSEFSKRLLFYDIAQMDNDVYADLNYRNVPTEIDAQLEGVQRAYDICCVFFDEEQANKLVCDYANHDSKSNGMSVIPKKRSGYKSIDEIVSALNQKLQQSFEQPRKLPKNPLGLTWLRIASRKHSDIPVEEMFSRCSRGDQQDKFLTACYKATKNYGFAILARYECADWYANKSLYGELFSILREPCLSGAEICEERFPDYYYDEDEGEWEIGISPKDSDVSRREKRLRQAEELADKLGLNKDTESGFDYEKE